MPFILEGIATTLNADGSVNIAPMGPIILLESEQNRESKITRLLFRPFQDSQTCQNLLAKRQGVFHITDDVLLFANAILKKVNPNQLPLIPATKVEGSVIKSACRWYEFQIVSCDTSSARAELEAEVLHTEKNRDFLGFNRAKHAVIETAILATRLHLIKEEVVIEELKKFQTIIQKTAGKQEKKAFELLCQFIDQQHQKEDVI